MTLQEKLLAYVNYIEKDEICKKYPSAKCLDIQIQVVFVHAPPEEGERFIKQAMLILKETGYNLTYLSYEDA